MNSAILAIPSSILGFLFVRCGSPFFQFPTRIKPFYLLLDCNRRINAAPQVPDRKVQGREGLLLRVGSCCGHTARYYLLSAFVNSILGVHSGGQTVNYFHCPLRYKVVCIYTCIHESPPRTPVNHTFLQYLVTSGVNNTRGS